MSNRRHSGQGQVRHQVLQQQPCNTLGQQLWEPLKRETNVSFPELSQGGRLLWRESSQAAGYKRNLSAARTLLRHNHNLLMVPLASHSPHSLTHSRFSFLL